MNELGTSPSHTATSSPRIGLPISPSPRAYQQSTLSTAHNQLSTTRRQGNPVPPHENEREVDQKLHHSRSQGVIGSIHCCQCCPHRHAHHTSKSERRRSLSAERKPNGEGLRPTTKQDSESDNANFLQKVKDAFSSKFGRHKHQTSIGSIESRASKGETSTKSNKKERQNCLPQQDRGKTYSEVLIEHWAE